MNRDRQTSLWQRIAGWKSPASTFFIVLIGIELVFLGGYAYRGMYSRYLQDDYCYGAEVKLLGFFPAQIDSYLHQMPYNSERFSLTFFSGLAEIAGGPRLAPFLAGLSIAAWAAGLYFTFNQWNRYFIFQVGKLALLACSLAVPILTFNLAPNLYQVLYWRSAMLPYLTPLIVNTWLLGVFFAVLRRKRLTPLTILVFGLGGFVAGGFSETSGLWQFCLWCAVVIVVWLIHQRDLFSVKVGAIVIVASALALGVMLLGPSNSAQLQPFERLGFLEMVTKSIKFTQAFIRTSLRSQLWAFFVVGCLGMLLGLCSAAGIRRPFTAFLGRWLLVAAGCYGLVFSITVPTMMAMSSPPEDRGLLPAMLTLILAVFASGWLAAGFVKSLASKVNRSWIHQSVSVLLGLIAVIYLASALPAVFDGLSAIQHRAQAWDVRHNAILEAKASGEEHVVVPAFDSIAQILELYPQEDFWVNVCAAKYYGIKGISAIEGYNGVQPIFQ